TARGRLLIRDLHALHDGRLLLIRGDHPRRGDDLGFGLGLGGGELEIDEMRAAEDTDSKRPGGIRDRQIDVVALRGSARARRDIDELSGAVDGIERGPDYRVL